MPQFKKFVFLQAAWSAPHRVKTIITTRDFNLATHIPYDIAGALSHRDKLNQFLPSTPFWLNQTHSNLVIEYQKNLITPNADASFSLQNNQVLAIMTADCLPILLTNQTGTFVASIHAGWRGLANNIIKNTLKLLDFKKEEILVFIGPAICANCFETGAEVKNIFTDLDMGLTNYFTSKKSNNKYLVDLRKIAEYLLLKEGILITNINSPNICTKCLNEWFYSYRENNETGRITSLIWLA